MGKHKSREELSREEFAQRVRDDEAARLSAVVLVADDRQRNERLTDEHALQRWIGEGGKS